jgi:hypothetical protein
MSQQPIQSFEEFWPHYVRAHAHKGNRMLHFAGTSAAMACVAAAILTRKPKLLALAPVLGYGAAWIGHFGVEKNTPATFGHPLWSLASDFVMWWKIATGTMDAEVERAVAEGAAAEAPRDHNGAGHADAASHHRPTDPHAIN